MIYDGHCHLLDISERDYQEVVIASVSIDYPTSKKNLEVEYRAKKVLRGVGVHPWRADLDQARRVVRELSDKAHFMGEIGLDYRLSEVPKEIQIKVFRELLTPRKTANVHALDAWRDAFNILREMDIRRAIFHWYTGPVDLLKDIEGAGYFIGVNPSISFQRKHREVVMRAPLDILITESDGGYEYRGLLLEPLMIGNTLTLLASLQGYDLDYVKRIIGRNFNTLYEVEKISQ